MTACPFTSRTSATCLPLLPVSFASWFASEWCLGGSYPYQWRKVGTKVLCAIKKTHHIKPRESQNTWVGPEQVIHLTSETRNQRNTQLQLWNTNFLFILFSQRNYFKIVSIIVCIIIINILFLSLWLQILFYLCCCCIYYTIHRSLGTLVRLISLSVI